MVYTTMASMDLTDWTQQQVQDRFDYHATTGLFYWKSSPRGGWAGKQAGTVINNGYVVIEVDGRPVLAHRLAWFYSYGVWPRGEVDHENRVRADNRIDNLRDVDKAGNQANASTRSDNTSGVRGVSWNKRQQKWVARHQVNGERRCLGHFETLELAAAARATAVSNPSPQGRL